MGLRDRIKSMEEQAWLPAKEQQPQQQEQVELTPGYDGYSQSENPAEYNPSDHLSEQSADRSPLAVLEDIKHNPAPKGAFATIIGGRPVDLHILEDYLLKTSPYALKTVMRYHNARTIEELRRYGNRKGTGINMKTVMLILVAVGMAVLGIIAIFFLPQIMNSMKGMFGGA